MLIYDENIQFAGQHIFVQFDLVKKLDFDPDPKSDPGKPVKSDWDPEIIFLDPTHCFSDFLI